MSESDSEGMDDWTPGSVQMRPPVKSVNRNEPSNRARRVYSTVQQPDMARRPLRLNVSKPSGLRNQVTTTEDEEEEDEAVVHLLPTRTTLTRGSKAKKPIVDLPTESEEGEEEEEEEEEEDDDDDEIEEYEGMQDDSLGQNEQHNAMQDVERHQVKARPTIKLNTSTKIKGSPTPFIESRKVRSVEEQEMNLGSVEQSDDEELSSVDSQDDMASDEEDEDEDDEEDTDHQRADSIALDTIRASAIGDDELGSDSDLNSSHGGTPDPSKLTRRQRAENESLMALSNEAQKKKFFTAEQITMRRAEMARRRKDLSEKRNEQEKLDTLDRLLHKRAPVRRTRAQMMADAEREEFGFLGGIDEEHAKAKPTLVRTVIGSEGAVLAVPENWENKRIGTLFASTRPKDVVLKYVQISRVVQVSDNT